MPAAAFLLLAACFLSYGHPGHAEDSAPRLSPISMKQNGFRFSNLLQAFTSSSAASSCGDGRIDWAHGEQCEPPDYYCCNAQCQFKPKTVVCRHATGECGDEAYCTGLSARCPRDITQRNGELCRANTGVCRNGLCVEPESSSSTSSSSSSTSSSSAHSHHHNHRHHRRWRRPSPVTSSDSTSEHDVIGSGCPDDQISKPMGTQCAGLECCLPSITRLVTFGHSGTDDADGDGRGGFTRYSNGKIWAEYVADALSVPLENKAWGGANSDFTNVNNPPMNQSGFLWQVSHYLPNGDIARTLHNVWIGFNDFWEGPGDEEAAVQNIMLGLSWLVAKGAKYITVFTEIQFDKAPGYWPTFDDASKCHAYTYASTQQMLADKLVRFNSMLKGNFTKFQSKYKSRGVQMLLFDAWTVHGQMYSDKVFSVEKFAWLDYRFESPFEMDTYMWWDGWHPTTAWHNIIATAYLKSVGGSFFDVASQLKAGKANGCTKPFGSPVISEVVSFGHGMSGDAGEGVRFQRSTNGRVWSEYVAERLGASSVSFSWVGARSDRTNVNSMGVETGLLAQLDRYAPSSATIGSTLHTIWVGKEDLWDGESSQPSDVISNIGTAVSRLVQRGAKHILILNEIRWAQSPLYAITDPTQLPGCQANPTLNANTKTAVETALNQFNGQLATKCGQWQKQNSNVHLHCFDTAEVHDQLYEFMVFAETTQAWYPNRYSHPLDVSNFMWHGLSAVTTRVHKQIAEAVLTAYFAEWFPSQTQ